MLLFALVSVCSACGTKRKIAASIHAIPGKIANAKIVSAIRDAMPSIFTYAGIFTARSSARTMRQHLFRCCTTRYL